MKKVAVAYFWLIGVGTVFSSISYMLWHEIDREASFLTIWAIIMFTLNIRALLAADEFFQRRLGVHKPNISASGNGRTVLVNAFETVIPSLNKNKFDLDLNQAPKNFYVDKTKIELDEVDKFLRVAWNRQRNKKRGLSRNYWTVKKWMERSDYESMMTLLINGNLVYGRTQGSSGKLIYPPAMSLQILGNKYLN